MVSDSAGSSEPDRVRIGWANPEIWTRARTRWRRFLDSAPRPYGESKDGLAPLFPRTPRGPSQGGWDGRIPGPAEEMTRSLDTRGRVAQREEGIDVLVG